MTVVIDIRLCGTYRLRRCLLTAVDNILDELIHMHLDTTALRLSRLRGRILIAIAIVIRLPKPGPAISGTLLLLGKLAAPSASPAASS